MAPAIHSRQKTPPTRKPDANVHGRGVAEALNRFWERRGVKPVAWVFFALVWLSLFFILLMVMGINPIFAYVVTTLGSKALKVPVKLDRASVSFAGRLSLGHLQIENPPGYSGSVAASFDELYAEIPIRSLLNREIDIPVLTVVRPVFNLEAVGKKQPTNWGVLMKNLSQSLPKKDEAEKADGEKRFKIRDMKIVNPSVGYRSSTFAEGISLNLKDVELKRVGNAPGSSSRTYLVLATLVQAVLTGSVKEKGLPSDVRASLTKELGEASKAFGAAFEGIK